MPSFGEYLKRERELREISLREISDETKISYRYLEAMEEDNDSRLPAAVFVKGFVRSYANYIGLDPDEATLRYQEYQKNKAASGNLQAVRLDHPGSGTDKKKRPIGFWIFLAVLVVAVVLALGYGLSRWKEAASYHKSSGP